MKSSGTESEGMIGSLRSLVDGLLASLLDRIELFAVELQEEKFRLIKMLILVVVSAFAGVMALTFISLTLVYLFWETARLAVLAGLAGFFTLAMLASVYALRRMMVLHPGPFSGTRRELTEDRRCIRNEN